MNRPREISLKVEGVIGKSCIFYESIASTNDELMRMANDEAAPHGMVLLADVQTAGKGRHGRVWSAAKGKDLLMSVLLRPECMPAEEAWVISMSMAVSVAEAIERMAPSIATTLKWPNDVLVGGRKLAGMLIESRVGSGGLKHVIAGLGINVNSTPEDFPPELRDTATSMLMETGAEIDRFALAASVLDYLDWKLGTDIRKRYVKRCQTIGARVKIETGSGTVEGTALGIDALGRLVLKSKSGTQYLSSGEGV